MLVSAIWDLFFGYFLFFARVRCANAINKKMREIKTILHEQLCDH